MACSPRRRGHNVRDVRQADRRSIEFAGDGAEQIAQLDQPLIGALLLGDDPINALIALMLTIPKLRSYCGEALASNRRLSPLL
jgi:hypothetical protein